MVCTDRNLPPVNRDRIASTALPLGLTVESIPIREAILT